MRRLGSVAAIAAVAAGLMWSCTATSGDDGERQLAEARRLLAAGRTNLAERRSREAAELFARVRQLQPANLDAGILEAQAAIMGGKEDRALALALELLAANPDEPRLSFLLAGIFERRSQFAQAMGVLTAAQRLEEDLALIYLESARMHWRFQQKTEAMAVLVKAEAILPPESPLAATVGELRRKVAGGTL